MTHVPTLAVLALLAAGLAASVPPAQAQSDCVPATPVESFDLRVGTVSRADGTHWYRHDPTTDGYYELTALNGGRIFIGVAVCNASYCSRDTTSAATVSCHVRGGGPFYVYVGWYDGAGEYLVKFQDGAESEAPGVSRTATLGPQSTPAVCDVPACDQTWSVGGTSTPPVGQACTPQAIVCAGPVGSVPLTPPVTVGSVCGLAAPACLDPVPLTPGFRAGIVLATVEVDEPAVGGTRTVGPIPVTGPPVPIVVCRDGCQVPVVPEAHARTAVTVVLVVGGSDHGTTVPLAA